MAFTGPDSLFVSQRTGSHSAGIHVPFTNCFVCRWFCVVHDPKPPLHSHNWLSFGKFQDTERFLIHCELHFSSRLPPSDGTWKYAKASSTEKNLERFYIYWYAPFCRVWLGCCAVEFGNPPEGLMNNSVYKCLLKVLCPVSRPITTLYCVLLKDSNRAPVARLGPEINSRACERP